MKSDDDEENSLSNLTYKAFCTFIFLLLVVWIYPAAIYPFSLFSLWGMNGGVSDWIATAFPILLWGGSLSFLIAEPIESGIQIPEGIFISTVAGVLEEIIFRWLFFLDAIVMAKLINFIFFGFLGFGIPEFFHNWFFGPIANFFTFGYMELYLFHHHSWAIGAGILGANALFRDGHKYQGFFGLVNSWCIGLFLFYIMFQHGLVAAIFIHFFYDFIVIVGAPLLKTIIADKLN